jgi:hypothetical protein
MSRLAILQFLGILLFVSATSVQPSFPPGLLEGIDVEFDTEPHMFPSNWYCKRIHAEAMSLPREYRTRAMDILNQAIAKYPEEVLFINLRKVYILQSLTFFGVPYGGTNFRDIVYLTYDHLNQKRTAEFMEGVFHHEFSSVLIRKFHRQLDREAWLAVNPGGFRYGEGGVQAIKNGEASLEFDANLHDLGFINKYSQSALEEDINVFAQNIFSGGSQFWLIVDSFDPIRKKTELIIRFYQLIDPVFTEEYFRSLAVSG